MAKRKTLTDEKVAELPTRAARYTVPDPMLPSHYVRVFPTGTKSYVVVKAGKWFTIGDARVFTLEQARERARSILPGDGATDESIEAVVKSYRARRVDNFRSRRCVVLSLDRFVGAFPGRVFVSIKRQEIAALADQVCDKHGTRSASVRPEVSRAHSD